VVDAILGFFLALFESLKIQIGPQLTEEIVLRLMSVFNRQQLKETLVHESSTGSKVIEKFLKILQLLIQAPAASFKTFLPGIISLCMEELYPILGDVSMIFIHFAFIHSVIHSVIYSLIHLFIHSLLPYL